MQKIKSIIIITAIALSFGFSTVKAQSHFGIRGGVNFATLNNAEDDDIGTNIGFLVGAYYTYNFQNSNFAIQPEILYIQKGAQNERVDPYTFNISYIEIPLLVKYSFNTGGDIISHVYAGPYFGIRLDAELVVEGETRDYNDEIQSTDFGVVFGGGVRIKNFDVGVRYSLGLTDLTVSDDTEIQNRVLSIVVGYNF